MSEQPVAKPPRKAVPPPDVYVRADAIPYYNKQIAVAMQQLFLGTANEGQQKLAVEWLLVHAAGAYDQSYRGPGRAEDTAFAEGRRFVANQAIKLSKINVGNMKD